MPLRRRQPARQVKKSLAPHKPTAWSAEAVNKVFDTIELLESIFLHLDARSVLKAQKVNRTFRNVVNGSVKIKKAIGLIPDEKANFGFPLWPEKAPTFHGLECSFDENTVSDIGEEFGDSGWWAGIYITWDDDHQDTIFKSIGSRCRALSICQPPIKSIQVTGSGCRVRGVQFPTGVPRDVVSERVRPDVAPERGYVTIGDLLDAVKRLVQHHEPGCNRTTTSCVDLLECEAILRLRDDDASVVEIKKLEEEEARELKRLEEEQARKDEENESAEAAGDN